MQNTPDSATELVIAVVAAVGTDIDLVIDQIATELADYQYESQHLQLSEYLAEHATKDFSGLPFDEKVWEAMSAGDQLRQDWDRSDALVLHAISDIVATRHEAWEEEADDGTANQGKAVDEAGGDGRRGEEAAAERLPPDLDRRAFVIRSLKTPDELETLRSVYGPRLVVIAAYSPRENRLKHLTQQIKDSRHNAAKSTWTYQPEQLIARDEKEHESRGQDVSGTFHRADFFIRGWKREVIETDLKRTFEILFGEPFRTPTRDEYGQFMASGAALRSAEFSRQVGASIANEPGSVISLGTNEVPRSGGGSPWEGDADDNREFKVSDIDTNRKHFDALAKRLSEKVDDRLDSVISEMVDGGEREALDQLREKAVTSLPSDLRAGGLDELTEFGRAVHAEMNALLDATRRGISVQDATLYTTTFPCHNCARHIIGAGIKRVVFIEPYIKSRTAALHSDAVCFDGADDPAGKVNFEAFVGVAPSRYREMFDAAGRKRLGLTARQDESGHKSELPKDTAVPVFIDSGLDKFRPKWREYRVRELLALEHFKEHMGDDG